MSDALEADRDLLLRLKQARPALIAAGESGRAEDGVYRFWHQSFKVFQLQTTTETITAALQAVDPARPLNPWFLQIVAEGTGLQFTSAMNKEWLRHTRPIVEAYFHADHMRRMAIECAEMFDDVDVVLPYNWATVLYLYQQRQG